MNKRNSEYHGDGDEILACGHPQRNRTHQEVALNEEKEMLRRIPRAVCRVFYLNRMFVCWSCMVGVCF